MKPLTLFFFVLSCVSTHYLYSQSIPDVQDSEFRLMNNHEIASGKNADSKYMFKIIGPNDELRRLNLGYERKIGKSFSLGGFLEGSSFYTLDFSPDPVPIGDMFNFELIKTYTINLSLEGRYYINQESLIAEGYGNNLNGVYVVGGMETQLYNSFGLRVDNSPYIGVGIQSRILKNGLIDFKFLVQYQNQSFSMYPGINAGFAFSKDYKVLELENARCNILKCFEEKKFQVKIPFNNFTSLEYTQRANFIFFTLRPKVSLEHRIIKGISMNHTVSTSLFFNEGFGINPSLRLTELLFGYTNNIRYYFLKRRNIANGKSADNLSGIYVASEIRVGKSIAYYFDEPNESKNFAYGLNLGYQSRLFKNFYFDVRGYYNRRTFTGLYNKYFPSTGINFEFGLMF